MNIELNATPISLSLSQIYEYAVTGAFATNCGTKTTFWVRINQEVAKLFLRSMGNNRNLANLSLGKYTCDMKNGRWFETHQGIAFNEEGHLVDGNHRLNAIIKADMEICMLVTYGLNKEACEALDRGRMRHLADAMKIAGYEIHSKRHIAIARRMAEGPNLESRHFSEFQLRDFILKNMEALLFCSSVVRIDKTPSAIPGVIGRAYYTVELKKLRRFAAVYNNTVDAEDNQAGDQTVRHLSLWSALNASKYAGNSAQGELYRKCQSALKAYLDGKDMTRLYERQEDLFPLPEENRILKEKAG